MPELPTREEIEEKREELLDKLALAKARLRQLSCSAAFSDDEQKMREAEDSVRRLEQKLDGLSYGLERVSEEERKRHEAANLARRREVAVEVLSLVQQRAWAAEELDEALDAVERSLGGLEALGRLIEVISGGWFGNVNDLQRQGQRRNFLNYIGALDHADIAHRARNDIGRPGRYSGQIPQFKTMALQALSTALPEVLDPQVQKEALARAREEQKSAEKS